MVEPEQLAGGLARLDPHDREVLYLSLHRRVPDEALGRLYQCSPAEVALRRAQAVERLADDLEVRRGDDLGSVLTGLLEPEAWHALEESGQASATPHAEVEAAEAPPEPEPAPEAAPAAEERPRNGRRFAAGIAAGAILAAGGAVVATALVDDDSEGPSPAANAGTRPFVPEEDGALSAPFPTDPAAASCYAIALVRGPAVLYTRPAGRRKVRMPARTDWGSPRVLGVVRQRGRWLAVLAPELRNGEVGWLPAEHARLDCVTWSLHADLSRRVLLVRRGGRTVRRIRVGVGRRQNPTPKGRFAVTDKLKVTNRGSPYGCCVLALTGHQTRLPPNWPGGDRLAMHATRDQRDLGRRVSLGCLRVASRHARWLIQQVPLGAPVFIKS